MSNKNEVVSFNDVSSDVSSMLELSDEQIAEVVGGLMKICGALTSCNINGDECPNLQSCGWNLWEPGQDPES